MKTRLHKFTAAFAEATIGVLCLTTLVCARPAFANTYPLYPPGSTVTLGLDNFLQSSPFNTSLNPMLQAPLGDHYNGHPGWNGNVAGPGDYFIGMFGHAIIPEFDVYAWESTSVGLSGDAGPLLTLGNWNGTTFTPLGDTVAARYYDTGEIIQSGFHVNASITPSSDFNIQGSYDGLNAIRVAVNPTGHNQVTAMATSIPEPCTLVMALFSAGVLGFIGYRQQRSKRRVAERP